MIKVCHLTSAHARYDTRIFLKQCRSLAKAGYDVTLIVADGEPTETKDLVKIKSVKKSVGRLNRMWHNVNNVLNLAIKEDADIYHLHDPELLRIALKLKSKDKKVIFDSHEDVAAQIVDKDWIPYVFRHVISKVYKYYQSYVCGRLDAISTATPYIKEVFLRVNPNTVNIGNFPILAEFYHEIDYSKPKSKITFIGGITEIRSAREMVKAMAFTKGVDLVLAGNFFDDALFKELKSYKSWEKTNFVGFLNRVEVSQLLSESLGGLVVFKPLRNHTDALPIKMFEYMAAGIPVICSNFPYWASIIVENNCGLSVDPLDPEAIGKKIQYLKDNPEKCKIFGLNGKKAIREKYNWHFESKKLLSLYKTIMN